MKIDKVIINVDEGKLKVRAQDYEVNFNVFEVLQHSNNRKDCIRTYASKEAFPGTKKQLHPSNILEKVIHHCIPQTVEEKKKPVHECVEKELTTN